MSCRWESISAVSSGDAGTAERPFTVGYLARVAPEKGLRELCDAYVRFRQLPGAGPAQLEIAGYLAPDQQSYLRDCERRLSNAGLGGEFHYRGTVDREQKIAFLQSLDVFSVPTVYVEPKGLFLLEAMACGIPVVQPRHGAFPEMVEKTSGGVLVALAIRRAWQRASISSGKIRLCAQSSGATATTASGSITASRVRPIACSRFTRGRCAERRGVSKRYPSAEGSVEVLADVSLSFARGDAAAIMGPSGSGKSTLLYILGALEPPTTGHGHA